MEFNKNLDVLILNTSMFPLLLKMALDIHSEFEINIFII